MGRVLILFGGAVFGCTLAISLNTLATPGSGLYPYAEDFIHGDGSVAGDIDLDGNVLTDTTGIAQIGSTCTSSHSLVAPSACFGTGAQVEFDADVYMDGSLTLPANEYTYFQSANSNASALRISQSLGQLLLTVGSLHGTHLVFGLTAYRGRDYDHPNQSNPTIFGHSATDPDSDNTEWWGLTHDQSNAVFSTGKGILDLEPAAAGLQMPTIIGTDTPTEPVSCTAATAGTFTYVDETDDSAAPEICICAATGDDGGGTPTMDWRQFPDPGTACSFF